MKIRLICLGFLLLVFATATTIQAQDQKSNSLTSEERISGLSKIWSEVKYNFVFFDKLKFDWDSLYQVSIPKVIALTDDFEYYRELQRICALLKDGHTNVFMPNSYNATRRSTIPLTTKFLEGKCLVDEVFNDTLVSNGIVKGIEIIKINGEDVIQYAQRKVFPYISTSTEQWLWYNKRELTKGTKNESIKISFKNSKGKVFEQEISRYMTEITDETPIFTYEVLPDNVGLLRIRQFWGDKFSEEFDKLYPEISKAKALLIDIRDNPGGNTGFGEYILQHLTNEKIVRNPWTSRMYVAAHGSWNYPQEWYGMGTIDIGPKATDKFSGPVAVIIDGGTFSAAEDFCTAFRSVKRGKIIGTLTGGSTGNPINFKLPGGGNVAICTKKDTYPDGTEFVGIGIIPDIEVSNTINSFRNNKDLVLERAILELK